MDVSIPLKGIKKNHQHGKPAKMRIDMKICILDKYVHLNFHILINEGNK